MANNLHKNLLGSICQRKMYKYKYSFAFLLVWFLVVTESLSFRDIITLIRGGSTRRTRIGSSAAPETSSPENVTKTTTPKNSRRKSHVHSLEPIHVGEEHDLIVAPDTNATANMTLPRDTSEPGRVDTSSGTLGNNNNATTKAPTRQSKSLLEILFGSHSPSTPNSTDDESVPSSFTNTTSDNQDGNKDPPLAASTPAEPDTTKVNITKTLSLPESLPSRRSSFFPRFGSKKKDLVEQSDMDVKTTNTTNKTDAPIVPDLSENIMPGNISSIEPLSTDSSTQHARRFKPRELVNRLLHGDANVMTSNNATIDTGTFVFSSQRGASVTKLNATNVPGWTKSAPWPLYRLGRKQPQKPSTSDAPSSSLSKHNGSTTSYSSWSPYSSESDDSYDLDSCNVTSAPKGSNETSKESMQTEGSVNQTKSIKSTSESSSLNETEADEATSDLKKDDTTNATLASAKNKTSSENSVEINTTAATASPFAMYPPGTVYPPNAMPMPMYAPPPGAANNQIFYMDGRPYRVLRPGSRGGQPGPPTGRGPQNGMIIAEVVAALLGTAMRLWFLTWVTRRLATQEETIEPFQRFVWERVNDRYERDVSALQSILTKPPKGVPMALWKHSHVNRQTRFKPPRLNLNETFDQTVIVVPVEVDKSGNLDVSYLTMVTSFLIQQHRAHFFGTKPPTKPPVPWWKKIRRNRQEGVVDEVLVPKHIEIVLLVNSPGGGVATYGQAAAQVRRLANEPGIVLTACVDHFAASGGYMIASQAHRLLAAPFATVGSIGVIMEGLNFNELARKYGIKPLTIKSGSNKNPLSTYGPVTSKDEKEETARLAKVHNEFKRLVVEGRPVLADSIEKVGDGSVFLGQEALGLNMVDHIQTSEEYIMDKVLAGHRVLRLHRSIKPKFSRRIHLNPLDVLPHLRAWLANSGIMDRLQDPSVLMTLGSAWQMARYVIRKYVDHRNENFY